MKKSALFVSILLYLINLLPAQNDSLKFKNSLFAELGGAGVFYSLNYDRAIPIKNRFGLLPGVGASLISTYERRDIYIPIHLKAYYRLKELTFEVGAALTVNPRHYFPSYLSFGQDKQNYTNVALFGQLGLKYDLSRRLYMGAAFTPLLFDFKEHPYYYFYPWIALQLGYRF